METEESSKPVTGSGAVEVSAFGSMSVRMKLSFIILATSATALLLAGVLFIVFQHYTFKQLLADEAATLAEIILISIAPAVSKDDAVTTNKALSVLSADPLMKSVTILRSDESVFAQYLREGEDSDLIPEGVANKEGVWFDNNAVILTKPVLVDGVKVGSITLAHSLKQLWWLDTANSLVVIALAFLSMAAALALSQRLQKVITDPVTDLFNLAEKVREKKDFSLELQEKVTTNSARW